MRITKDDLQNLVDRINTIEGYAKEPYDTSKPGCNPNPNVYHLDWAYGGVCLIQMMDKGTGVRSIIPGFGTKKELYEKLQILLQGMEITNQ
mgnify:FL=1|jgi:hypothetical protein